MEQMKSGVIVLLFFIRITYYMTVIQDKGNKKALYDIQEDGNPIAPNDP